MFRRKRRQAPQVKREPRMEPGKREYRYLVDDWLRTADNRSHQFVLVVWNRNAAGSRDGQHEPVPVRSRAQLGLAIVNAGDTLREVYKVRDASGKLTDWNSQIQSAKTNSRY
jgi:hypothetical protein